MFETRNQTDFWLFYESQNAAHNLVLAYLILIERSGLFFEFWVNLSIGQRFIVFSIQGFKFVLTQSLLKSLLADVITDEWLLFAVSNVIFLTEYWDSWHSFHGSEFFLNKNGIVQQWILYDMRHENTPTYPETSY